MTTNPQSVFLPKLPPAQFRSLDVGYSKLWWKCSEKLRGGGGLKSACNRGKGVLSLSAAALPPLSRSRFPTRSRSHGRDKPRPRQFSCDFPPSPAVSLDRLSPPHHSPVSHGASSPLDHFTNRSLIFPPGIRRLFHPPAP